MSIGEQELRCLVVGLGKYDVSKRHGHPTILAVTIVGLRLLQDSGRPAHVLDVLLGGFHRL